VKNSSRADIAALILRLGFGVSMLPHGINKLDLFSNGFSSVRFADPIGVGPGATLILTLFAEIFCSVLIVLGIRVKEATIPLMITMLVAIFHCSWGRPLGEERDGHFVFDRVFGHFLFGEWEVCASEVGVESITPLGCRCRGGSSQVRSIDTASRAKKQIRSGLEVQSVTNTECMMLGLEGFLSVDPLAPDYPHNSPYAFSENRVIDGVELEGLERISYMFMLDEETCEVACIGISSDYEVQERILEISVYNTKGVLLAFDDFEYTDFERPQKDPNVAPIQDFNNYLENRGTFDNYDNLEEFANAYIANIYGKKNKTNTYYLQIPFQEFTAPLSSISGEKGTKDALNDLSYFYF